MIIKKTISGIVITLVCLVFFSTQAFAAALSPNWWASDQPSGPGSLHYVPAGQWEETVAMLALSDYSMVGSYGSIIADPLPSSYGTTAFDPIWAMTSFTRTGCTGVLVPNIDNTIYAGDLDATYTGNWMFKLPDVGYPYTWDTYHVTNMNLHVTYHLTYLYDPNTATDSYTLSNIVWDGSGLIDENNGYKFTFYANAVEDTQIDYPTDMLHTGYMSYAYGQVSAVPIPGAVWLFGTGLLGLMGIRRKITR